MIEENDNYKVMFYFLSPNVVLLFDLVLNSQIKCFIFLRNSVLCIWYILSNEGIKHQFHLSLIFFGKQREFSQWKLPWTPD